MSEPLHLLDHERRHELWVIFVTAAAYACISGAIELATLERQPGSVRLVAGWILVAAIAGRYAGWSRRPFDGDLRGDLPYLFGGTALVVALAFTVNDRVMLFFYMLSFEGCSVFLKRRLALVWSAATFALALVVTLRITGGLPDGQTILQDALVFALNLVVTELIIRQEQQRHRVEGLLLELDSAYQKLQHVTTQAEALAIAQERTRLAREMHDTLGHTLTALDVQMSLLARLPEDQQTARREAAAVASRLVRDGLSELRRAVQALRPGALETFSLPDAITALVRDFQAATGLAVETDIGSASHLPANAALALYRAAQEGLTNVGRHARATRAYVSLREDAGQVTLTVEDDGVGSSAPFGYGLRGIAERAAVLGGSFSLTAAGPSGCRLTLTLPC